MDYFWVKIFLFKIICRYFESLVITNQFHIDFIQLALQVMQLCNFQICCFGSLITLQGTQKLCPVQNPNQTMLKNEKLIQSFKFCIEQKKIWSKVKSFTLHGLNAKFKVCINDYVDGPDNQLNVFYLSI